MGFGVYSEALAGRSRKTSAQWAAPHAAPSDGAQNTDPPTDAPKPREAANCAQAGLKWRRLDLNQ